VENEVEKLGGLGWNFVIHHCRRTETGVSRGKLNVKFTVELEMLIFGF
jgi:hypothetical protein